VGKLNVSHDNDDFFVKISPYTIGLLISNVSPILHHVSPPSRPKAFAICIINI
jgi:hypothetical protein